MTAKIITVTSEKGGVAKTTVAVNLAYTLATTADVLLIDMDPQGNASKMCRFLPEPKDKSLRKHSFYYYNTGLYELITDQIKVIFGVTDNFRVEECIHKTQYLIDIIPNDRSTQRIDYSLYENASAIPEGRIVQEIWQKQYHLFLYNAIQKIKDRYTYIVIDTPPSFDFFTMNALMASDYTLIPVGLDELEIQGLEDIFIDINWFQNNYNPTLKPLGIVITRYPSRKSNVDEDLEEQLRSHRKYGKLVFDNVVKEGVVFKEAAVKRKPAATHFKKKSPIDAKEIFWNIGEEVKECIIRLEVQTSRKEIAATKEKENNL